MHPTLLSWEDFFLAVANIAYSSLVSGILE